MVRRAAISGEFIKYECPGCGEIHRVRVKGPEIRTDGSGPRWSWNGSLEKPSLVPSLKVTFDYHKDGIERHECCHSVITDGRAAFCNDSTHALAGKTADLPEWPKETIPMSDETNPQNPETNTQPSETNPPVSDTTPSYPSTEVHAAADGSATIEGHSDHCSGSHPPGLTCGEARALRDAAPGSAVNVKDPAAAIAYIKGGYAPDHVLVYDRDGVQHWPEPPAPPAVPDDRPPSSPARTTGKPPAQTGSPMGETPTPTPAAPNTPRHESVEARSVGKPPAS